MRHGRIIDTLTELALGDDPTADDIIETLASVVVIRNLADHHAAGLTALLESTGTARRQGRKVREILQSMGVAPHVAGRWLRVGTMTASTPQLARHTGLGAISGEYADAVVKGMAHIGIRSPEPIADRLRQRYMTQLLAQSTSGATPAQIAEHARAIGSELANDSDDGIPAADDRRINTLDTTVESDGRVTIRGNVHGVLGEKLITAIDALSKPRNESDGSPDARTPGQVRADALEAVLDHAADADATPIGAPKTQLLVTIPADQPERSALQFVGPLTRQALDAVTCDGSMTELVLRDGVPLDISANARLFPAHLRRGLIVRDGCCIKCGAKGSRLHAHHIVHWAVGGPTVLENGCLLCPACHDDVHSRGWEVFIGHDKHPWLIPPASVDPGRKPVPAYNRRTMRLDEAA